MNEKIVKQIILWIKSLSFLTQTISILNLKQKENNLTLKKRVFLKSYLCNKSISWAKTL
jgi:hypothetical protein